MGNEDYIDTVVLPEEPSAADDASIRPDRIKHDISVVNDVRLTRVSEIEIDALTIDESGDTGGDPYNSTGKHCVLKQPKD